MQLKIKVRQLSLFGKETLSYENLHIDKNKIHNINFFWK